MSISYSGKASNVEVYYEPDADLDFVFTDDEGNLVEPESLYKGNYKDNISSIIKMSGLIVVAIEKPNFDFIPEE